MIVMCDHKFYIGFSLCRVTKSNFGKIHKKKIRHGIPIHGKGNPFVTYNLLFVLYHCQLIGQHVAYFEILSK
jgi:hypothetical protein